ncbi:MAG: SDR family oxidoreductase [Pseudomonadota bacterium]
MPSNPTTSTHLLCLGYGYTAAALARRLEPQGWTITGTTRSHDKAEKLKQVGINPIIWGGETLGQEAFSEASAVLISTGPDKDGCPAYRAAREAVIAARENLKWIGYLSSNGVYGDHDGAWVDEDSLLKPTTNRGKARVRAEADWAAFGVEFDLPIVIFRLPGIYGPGRSALDSVRAGTAKRIYKEGQVFSRAHVDDIASALHASLNNPSAGDLFNIADDLPAPPQDVTEYACQLLGVDAPPLIPIEDAELSEMGRSFYSESKRVSNARMKEALGLKLTYPDYKAGLDAILKLERTSGSA